jgi:protein involved in polysaccharide export with SLBB domain
VNNKKAVTLLVALLTLVFSQGLNAQTRTWDTRGLQATRSELLELVANLEATAASTAYSGTLRQRARAEAALIRKRLEEGDIRVGDRILLRVENHQFPTENTVVAGRRIILPEVGEIPLEGVLRSELQDHMATHIGRFIRNPVVEARPLIRIQVSGAVSRPGFFMAPSDMLLEDAIMLAGGPAVNARTDRLRIERAGSVIWDGERLRTAMLDGRTLDQLNVEAGDQIVMPAGGGSTWGRFREALMITSSLVALVTIGQALGAF